jgi:hypothetical protein
MSPSAKMCVYQPLAALEAFVDFVIQAAKPRAAHAAMDALVSAA